MFKKFKDKLAEEVKSSPQRIQQFAQAAQAAVTSASSSISDITNNDLFSIGDNDSSSKVKTPSHNQQIVFQEVSLKQPGSNQQNIDSDFQINLEMNQENQRQRRLSNSSFASDISFRLPSYESPLMYHLQSDMEVSASEAEEKGFSGSTVNLDRVTKEQLYAAYRRTQDRCTKYKTQYADLARHYKLLERENAKARNVLVETQDKALRRISELKEQCSLEQSAKAHLEKALRIEIEEKNMKIETLNTKLMFLQNSNTDIGLNNSIENNKVQDTNNGNDNYAPLIKLATDDLNNERKTNEDNSETTVLNNKIEKLEQLLNKYKESLKSTKERNGQLTTELQKVSTELETKIKENEQLQAATISLTEAREKIQELNENIEYLQNKNNSFEFSKNKELSILEINLKNAQEEIKNLHKKIEILSKREEEYAISLAENKLSIHKELESKEAEIKSLNDSVANSNDEIQSLNIIINDYKNNISKLEDERSKLRNEINDLNIDKAKIGELKAELEIFTQKYQSLEQMKSKADEEYNCLQLQVKQETAEKLAMIDRNVYLENRNTQLIEENTKKSSQISNLEKEIQKLKLEVVSSNKNELEKSHKEQNYVEEVNKWKLKCNNLESEIQEERVELEKLQSEIEKLLSNHESIQNHNEQLIITVASLKSEITVLKTKLIQSDKIKSHCEELKTEINHLRLLLTKTLEESKVFKQSMNTTLHVVKEKVTLLNDITTKEIARLENETENLRLTNASLQSDVQKISDKYKTLNSNYNQLETVNNELKSSIHDLQAENISQVQKIQALQNQNENNVKEMNNYAQISEKLNEESKNYNFEKASLKEQINTLKQQNDELLISLKETETNKKTSHNEFKKIADKYDDVLNKLNILTKEHSDLLEMKEDYKKKTDIILNLEKQIDSLNQENTSLKKLSETISKNFTDIEHKLKEERESHSLIEIEKDRLNSVICELESNIKKEKDVYAKNTQTDNLNEKYLNDSKEEIERLNKEIEALKSINNELSEEIKDNKLDLTKMEESLLNQNGRVIELNSLKEENKRLQSDIEGLQSYMTKVSKENSQLNDKLREIIATNDGFPEKNDILIQDLESLKSEIQLGKDKIDNLIRENSLLAEENLELKDQIKSQTYTNSNLVTDNNSEKNDDIVRKYSNAIETKNKLEKKLHDMELINQSVNSDMQQMQANNEKLRLSNEKLERRLDEALVSLRHLHSLQENTELEYLRNILYEYLTGSGTHSMTLAKVLSAVVKFDAKQTEIVLEKEKERQSLLHQLRIL
ncbi:golgin subfamily A member 4-like [Melitaea cinxia]|uniref:golgin subfamily A member 4-like n=1 Tax=Melitaea cinxia TaxID=113334 RepID=UPI001E271C13|nr:golgin subfamily A member 4-like [Melitaea cinxia]